MTDTPSVAEVLDAFGRLAPWGRAAAWDPVGLQLGDRQTAVRRAVVCHEVTEEVVERVEVDPPDLLVTYHPLLFRPVTSLVAGSSPEGRALRLARAGVALAVAHTSFDAASGGAADALAAALSLGEVVGFGPLDPSDSVKVVTFVPAEAVDRVADLMASAGAGTIGNYTRCSFRIEGTGTFFAGEGTDPAAGTAGELNREPEVRLEMTAPRGRETAVVEALVAAHPYEEPAYDVYDRRGEAGMVGRVGRMAGRVTVEEVADLARRSLGDHGMRVGGELDRAVEWVAVVPGSGGDLLEEAAALGADVMVTGDVSHHRAAAALSRGLAVIDATHAASERPGIRRLREILADVVPGTVETVDVDPNPWRRREES